MKVDYLKLSEQYASFLIAIGGVSITVLALVLSFSAKSNAFLVASLVVATISCFTGAHMMAETAAFISYYKDNSVRTAAFISQYGAEPSGERLFLLASINIFIAVVLVIFALMLLPMVLLEKDKATEIKLISTSVFAFVIIAVLSSVALSVYRMPAPLPEPQRWIPIGITFVVSIVLGLILFSISKESLLEWSFIPIIALTLISLLWFAWTFNDGGKVGNLDIWLFSFAVTFTCASLVVARIKWLPNE